MSKTLQAIVEIAGTLSPTLGKSIEGVIDKLDGINVQALAAGAAVGGIAIATGAAVLKAGSYLVELGDGFNQTMNDLSASTGATGDELEGLGDIVKDVYADGIGESLGEVADGLALVKQATGAVGDELKEATSDAFLLSDTFGFGIEESSRTATSLMKSFNMSAEEAYNTIALGAQNGANKNGDLLDTLNEYSSQYAALGLSSDQFIDSLISGANEGLWSIDKVGDAVKEFNIRAKDGSKTSREAFEGLGMDADKMSAAFAAGGESAQAAFFETVNALQAIEDPLQKNAIGVSLFGTQFEDLEAGVLPVLSGIKDAAYDDAAALDNINNVKYDDLGSAFEQIKRTAEVGLLPLASSLANTLTDIMPAVGDAMESIAPIVELVGTTLFPAIIPPMTDIISGLSQLITWLSTTDGAFETLAIILGTITALIVAYNIQQALATSGTTLWATISGGATAATTALGAAFAFLTSPIGIAILAIGALIAAGVAIYKNWDTISAKASDLYQYLSNVFSNIGEFISNIGSGISSSFRSTINSIINGINGFIRGVNKIKIPDWVPGVGGKGINIPILPQLASGGFTDGISIAGEAGKEAVISFLPQYRKENIQYWQEAGKMLGVLNQENDKQPLIVSLDGLPMFASGGFTEGTSIAGEAGKEAIISFDPARRDENIGYWAAAGQLLGLDDFSLAGMSESTVIIYDFSGFHYNPTIEADGDTDAGGLMERLKQHELEFFDWLERWLARREVGNFARHTIY